jgi:hypothetical protein
LDFVLAKLLYDHKTQGFQQLKIPINCPLIGLQQLRKAMHWLANGALQQVNQFEYS